MTHLLQTHQHRVRGSEGNEKETKKKYGGSESFEGVEKLGK